MSQTEFVSSFFMPTGRSFGHDLTRSVLVFGGLFITAAAVCSTLDMSRPSAPLLDDVRVDDYAIGPAGFDPYALDCDSHHRSAKSVQLAGAGHCKSAQTRPANTIIH